MYWSTWYELRCPGCGKSNFVNNGDEQDLTGCDVEWIQCCFCETVFDFEGRSPDEYPVDYDKGLDMRKVDG